MLRPTRPCEKATKLRWRESKRRCSTIDCGARHPKYRTRGFILSEGQNIGVSQLPHRFRTVRSHARKQDSRSPAGRLLEQASEENIHRRAVPTHRRGDLIDTNRAVPIHRHVVSGRRDTDLAGAQTLTVSGDGDIHPELR
jgi:hypothetical protein